MRVIGVLTAFLFAAPAFAQTNACTWVPASATQQITGPDGVCKKVTNTNASASLCALTATAAEWQSFYNNNKASYTLAACRCDLPWGGSIAQGESVTAYAASNVPYGSTCQSQVRVCSNGALGGSYMFQSCTVNPCVRTADHSGWQTVANGCNDDLYDNCGVYVSSSDNGSCGHTFT